MNVIESINMTKKRVGMLLCRIYDMTKIVFCILILSINSVAQINNQNLEFISILDSAKIKKVQFKLNSFNYLKNNEYFNPIADGYTLLGVYVNPKVTFQINEKVLVEGGIFIDKQFGRNGIQAFEPTFSIKYQPNNWKLIFGNLEGNVAHQMIEPLMNFEQIIKRPQELGIQAKYQNNTIFFDTWLDWQKATLAGEKGQEEIMFGVNFSTSTSLSNQNLKSQIRIQKLSIQPIAQLTVFHRGGQNIISDLPVKTYLNYTLGLNLEKSINPKWNLSFKPYFVGYLENKNKGKAAYLNCQLHTANYQMILSYWHGNNYNSPIGGDLFQSYSRKFGNENYIEKNRNLLIFRLIRDWRLADELNLSFRIEPHYDFNNRIFEHSEGLYLRLKL